MKVDNRASSNIKTDLVVFTVGPHIWVFGEPDKNGQRTVYLDAKEEGRGNLLGSVRPTSLGYMTQSSDVEVERCLGVKFLDRPEEKCVLISSPVIAVIIMDGAAVKIGDGLRLLSSFAGEYYKDAVASLKRNRHKNDLSEEDFGIDKATLQKIANAVIVDFINFIGAQYGVDYAMYTKDLAEELKKRKKVKVK